jgi:L-ribulose-5-phosphate 3-epimerase
VERFQLRRGGGNAAAGRSFEKHLVSAVQQGCDFAAGQDARAFHARLIFPLVADDGSNAMLRDLHASVGQMFGCETGLLQQLDALGKCGNFRSRAKEHASSIGTVEPKIPIAAITDEFSPRLEEALPVLQEIGMAAVELRVIGEKNILDMSDEELKRAKDQLEAAGLPVVSIASPLLKCVLPKAPEIDSRFQHDVFASKHTYEDQLRLTERAFAVAKFFGARIVRVFSYWRTVEPLACQDAILRALSDLAGAAARQDLSVGLENEHACNVATAAETARILALIPHPNLQIVWDPANALVAGEDPFPFGYSLLPRRRIAHVHAKDCHLDGVTPVWGPLGTRHVRWKSQIRALLADGYKGYISLETHWPGPEGNKLEASRICGWNLRGLAAA